MIVNWFCTGNRREKSLPALQSPHSLRSLRSFPLPSLRGLKRRPRNAPASYFHSQKKTTFRPDTGTGSPSLRDVRHFWQTLRQSCPCFQKWILAGNRIFQFYRDRLYVLYVFILWISTYLQLRNYQMFLCEHLRMCHL